MNRLLVILPFHTGDFPLAIGLLEWIRDLGDGKAFPIMLLGSSRLSNHDMLRAKALANEAFERVFVDRAPGLADEAWPRGANMMFKHGSEVAGAIHQLPFLWLEPDCVPMRRQWLTDIAKEYGECGKPFMGNVRKQTSNPLLPGTYLPGCSVYPANAYELLRDHFGPITTAWDVSTAHVTVPLAHKSRLFYEWWGMNGKPPVFKNQRRPTDAENVMLLGQIPSEAALFHRSKDGRLIGLLREKYPTIISPRKREQPTPEPPAPAQFSGTLPSVHISLLCCNRLDLTRQCLASLEANTTLPYTLSITDNASTDGTGDYLARWSLGRPNVRIVTNSENLGYKDPHNLIFDYAVDVEHAEFFVILNNDIDLGHSWLEAALAPFQSDAKLALVGSNGVCSRLNEHLHGTSSLPHQPPEYIEGSLLVIRTSIVSKLAPTLFDPNLKFIYCEDTDLSLRVREAGYRIQTVNLNTKHFYNQTVRYLDDATRQKIKQCQIDNVDYLKKRWAIYIRRRNFRYQVQITRRYALGDVIDVTPIIPAIKAKWPECEIVVETDFPEVFAGNPDVKACRAERDIHYDLSLAYERHPQEHIVTAYARACEVNVDLSKVLPQLHQTRHDEGMAERMLPWTDGKMKWAVLHPGPTGWRGRDWPIDRWTALNQSLLKQGWRTAVIGSGDTITGAVDLRGKLSLGVLGAIIKRAELFVGLDSGPSHIAQAVGTPSVVLFGTILPEYRLYPAARAVAVSGDRNKVACIGEHHRLTPPIEHSQCSGECMRSISVDMVLEAVQASKFTHGYYA